MGYISGRKTRLQNRLASIQARLTQLYAVMEEMAASGVESYAFDSGEGSQRTTRRSLKDIQDIIRELEAQEDHYYNELYNMGLVNIVLRRKRPC